MTDRINWHTIVQDIFDSNLELLSGKRIVDTRREVHRHYEIDYFCRVGPGAPESDKIPGIRPFDHFLEYNLIEYKSINETLNDTRFREYVGRSMVFESCFEDKSLKGNMTLTIFLTRMPETLLGMDEYAFEQVTPWKYFYDYKGLAVYLLIQKNMRGIDGGLPLAYLQVLEGNKKAQSVIWANLAGKKLDDTNKLKNIMMSINKEVYMSIASDIIAEVKPKFIQQGKIASLSETLETLNSHLYDLYKDRLASIQTLEEYEELKTEIYKAMGSH